MNQSRFIGLVCSSLALTLACSSGASTHVGSGGSGTGSGGRSAGTGGATSGSGGATTGTGGSSSGAGGKVTGTGGGAVATGGTTTGTGGAATGSGGSSAGGGGGRAGAGTGGVVSASGGAGGSVSTGSVLERNNHPSRDGHFAQPQITKASAKAASKTQTPGFTGTFTGAMWASPVFLAGATPGKGMYFVVTTGNDVVALDETDGHTVWKTNIGSSPTANGVSCGNIHPLGILSTPVIDPVAGKIYVAGAIGTTSISKHEVHALSVTDGADTKTGGWPVDVSGISSGTLSFGAALSAQNQRSALSLVNGILYVAYGGHVGDCGQYHGWVVGIDTKNPAMKGGWATGGVLEGIWAPGGMASDGTGVFAATGNSGTVPSAHLDSEEVVKVTGLGVVDKATKANTFYPTRWTSMDGGPDLDLGSVNPMYIEMPASTPSTMIVQISKDGYFYLLDSKNLGGVGGQVNELSVAGVGMNIHTVPAAYKTAMGMHVVFSTDNAAKCPATMPSGKVVMSVLLTDGSPAKPQVIWCAALGNPVTAPVATTTDGTNEAIVWYMSGGKLVGVDGDSGTTLFTSTDSCSGVRQWSSPIAVNGQIVTAADGHLCSWTVK